VRQAWISEAFRTYRVAILPLYTLHAMRCARARLTADRPAINQCALTEATNPLCHPMSAPAGAQEERYPSPMSHYDPSLQDRLSLAAEAKKNLLAKFKKNADPNSPEAIEKRREREAIAAARAERQAQREIARREHEAELARQAAAEAAARAEAERIAAEQAAAEAAARAELDAAAEAELKAQQKAARDARYAARKASKKKKRRGL
jgi:Family of unknown function (DUF6481)